MGMAGYNVIRTRGRYSTLLREIGEGMRDLHGTSWEKAEAACLELWPTYVRTTGLEWAEVRNEVRSTWERTPSRV